MFLTFSSLAAPKVPAVPKDAAKDEAVKEEATSAEASTNEVNAAEAGADSTEDSGFARYRTITDRMPFGPEPVGFDPESPGRGGGGAAGGAGGELTPDQLLAQQSEEAQRIISAVRVSVLNVTPSGKIAVGFTDNSRQPPSNYYLKVGESRDGWSVKEADAAAQTGTLSKGGVDAELKLGEGSDGKSGGKGVAKAGAARPAARGRQLPRGGLPGHAIAEATSNPDAEEKEEPPPTGGNALAQLRERARQKRAAAKAEEDERARQVAEERRQREQQQRQAAEEREQQREALLQIQEELRRQREQREQQREHQAGEEQSGEGGNE